VRKTRSLLESNFVRSPIDGHYLLPPLLQNVLVYSATPRRRRLQSFRRNLVTRFRPQKPLSPPVSLYLGVSSSKPSFITYCSIHTTTSYNHRKRVVRSKCINMDASTSNVCRKADSEKHQDRTGQMIYFLKRRKFSIYLQ